MYLRDNPVLQRELLVNLRMRRGFALLFGYIVLLGGVVYLAWPEQDKLDVNTSTEGRELVNLFFQGQYFIISLMVPAFTAGSIAGEKERKSYEMLLASPLRPGAIVLGKLLASLLHLAILMFSSLPIVMVCLPLGGVSFYEVLAVYSAMIQSVILFGMISLASSSYFQRTASALVVSYLLILPLALFGLLFWSVFDTAGAFVRLVGVGLVLPAGCALLVVPLFVTTSRRLLYPPDLGSEGKEVVDEKQELHKAVGLVIQRDQFPDRLFAPPKREGLLEDGADLIYDKEMRSELFSQGTLMLRLVIQVSMFLAIPLMAVCLYIWPEYAPWYIAYVVLFNMLVGPVFSAGSVTSERERETLDLLLVTLLSPWQILRGKLVSGLRVSSVLTGFLLWPLLLACVFVSSYYANLPTMVGYVLIVLLTSITTSGTALFCSVLFQKTSVSITTSYLVIVALFMLPLAMSFFATSFFQDHRSAEWFKLATLTSPFAAAFSLPLDLGGGDAAVHVADWPIFFGFVAFYLLVDAAIASVMIWFFNVRWRVSG